jgi:hypothetical protein
LGVGLVREWINPSKSLRMVLQSTHYVSKLLSLASTQDFELDENGFDLGKIDIPHFTIYTLDKISYIHVFNPIEY